jgi:hypothetical protein
MPSCSMHACTSVLIIVHVCCTERSCVHLLVVQLTKSNYQVYVDQDIKNVQSDAYHA